MDGEGATTTLDRDPACQSRAGDHPTFHVPQSPRKKGLDPILSQTWTRQPSRRRTRAHSQRRGRQMNQGPARQVLSRCPRAVVSAQGFHNPRSRCRPSRPDSLFARGHSRSSGQRLAWQSGITQSHTGPKSKLIGTARRQLTSTAIRRAGETRDPIAASSYATCDGPLGIALNLTADNTKADRGRSLRRATL